MRYIGLGKINFGQGKVCKVREFHFRLRLGTLFYIGLRSESMEKSSCLKPPGLEP